MLNDLRSIPGADPESRTTRYCQRMDFIFRRVPHIERPEAFSLWRLVVVDGIANGLDVLDEYLAQWGAL